MKYRDLSKLTDEELYNMSDSDFRSLEKEEFETLSKRQFNILFSKKRERSEEDFLEHWGNDEGIIIN